MHDGTPECEFLRKQHYNRLIALQVAWMIAACSRPSPRIMLVCTECSNWRALFESISAASLLSGSSGLGSCKVWQATISHWFTLQMPQCQAHNLCLTYV